MFKQQGSWVLASSSAKRAEFLKQFGFEFEVCPADIDETPKPDEPATKYCARVCREKALKIRATNLAAAVIIGGDTCFSNGAEIYGKANSENDAQTILLSLSGKWHEVISCIYLDIKNQAPIEIVSETRLKFFDFSADFIKAYLKTGEWKGKAGCCSIEELGASLIEHLDGSWPGVCGFPIEQFLHKTLERGLIDLV